MTLFIFLITLGYLMGSICSAVLVCRMSSLPDPREHGSQNPGATNVLRLAGKKYAALVMVMDILKGTIPVVIAKALDAEPIVVGFTALAAVLGHMFPIFFQFKGGKGVATALGALLGFHFLLGVMVSATWLLVAKFTKRSSLASITAISLAPFYSLILIGRNDILIPLFFITFFVLIKHSKNISRLMAGTEPKIHFKSPLLKEVMEDDTEVKKPKDPKATKPKVSIEKKKKEKKSSVDDAKK